SDDLEDSSKIPMLVACIMSAENAKNRSENFFWKMFQAFAVLGAKVELDKALIKDGIRLEVHGDLEELKKRGGVYKEFANMVEVVKDKTNVVDKPKLRLVWA